MFRNLLASTAVAALMTTGALAQTATPPQKGHDRAVEDNIRVYEFEFQTLATDATNGILASNMIGKSVMSGETDDADDIGDINDVVIGRDGKVHAVIVGVGGFLGIAEKDVAVEFERLSFVAKDDGEFDIATDATREELENAATYERPDHIPNWMETSSLRDEMDQVAEGTDEMTDSVRTEAVDPARKRIDETRDSASAEDSALADDEANDMAGAMTQVDAATISTAALIGTEVQAGNESDIGEVSQVLLDEDGQAKAVIIDVGGFLGFGEKPVAVAFDSLKLYETDNGDLMITVPFTKSDLENAETFDPAAFKSNPDGAMLR
ncbi:PRC-barrel domain-containing protein [Labrenzia sp. 011]|uniref:PRC-barrel domain-containing protein n=1 Tax=Labrenzia sp. 011 TaxID=2171494 RepID=UPI000D50A114|nr:PRC-barrel domain-containing protein [Labrenzia sp. 011]PVB59630.1 photosystem reaction center subunit H [Labrenzia sp. 011]